MPRPRIYRRIFFDPHVTFFKPAGIMMKDLEESILSKEELEAVRLIDYKNMEQNKVAKKMKVSQPTFSRVLKSARKKIADALINGKAIKIEGGVFKMVRPRGRGLGLSRGQGLGIGGRGRMGGFAAGPEGLCVCPKCEYKEPHQTGLPCYNKKCPKCGTKMTRG